MKYDNVCMFINIIIMQIYVVKQSLADPHSQTANQQPIPISIPAPTLTLSLPSPSPSPSTSTSPSPSPLPTYPYIIETIANIISILTDLHWHWYQVWHQWCYQYGDAVLEYVTFVDG